MSMSRRSAITLMAGAAVGVALPAWAEDKDKKPSTKPVRNPIAVSTYSFWRYRRGKRATMEECIDLAAEMGFDAVELLEVQMHRKDDAYLQQLKRRAFVNGLTLCGMSTHQGFVSPDAKRRDANIKRTEQSIELAYKLGIPTIRVNTGRWGTTRSFNQLMKDRGIEKPLDGYTDEDRIERR